MTKSWEDIRPEACRLYLSGQTLSQVRIEIEAKFDFKAACVRSSQSFKVESELIYLSRPRSYRLYFKKWGITRSAQIEKLKGHTSTSVAQSTVEHDEGDLESGHNGTAGFERAHSMPIEARPSETSTELLRHQFQSLQTNALPSIADAFWTFEIRKTESIYGELRIAAEFQRHQILQKQIFKDGYDNVLHYVARTDDYWTLNYVVEFMQTETLSIDITSSKRRTALEIAIHMGRQVMVKTLLDAKASLSRANDDGQQPLHFAISVVADSVICRLLLDYGAKADETYFPRNRQPISPMEMALDQFLLSSNENKKDVLCAILQELVSHEAKSSFDNTKNEPLAKFIKATAQLDVSSPSVRQKQTQPAVLLGYYLSAGRNPLGWFPKYHCPASECKSLAAFIFSHTPKSGLSAILIEISDMTRYGLDLASVLARPCSMRYSSAQDPSINDLLNVLLRRMRNQNVIGFIRTGLLREMVEDTPRKKLLERLRTLIESGYVCEQDCTEALSWIGDIEESDFRLSFAELLLSRIGPTMDIVHKSLADLFFGQRLPQFHDLTEDVRLHERVRNQVLPALGISSSQKNEECIEQGVMHAFTRLLLEKKISTLDGSASAIIYTASRLRQRYRLSDIPISRELLLELQRPATRTKRRFGNVPRSEATGSPDSIMNDHPDYPTPESTRSY